MFTQDDAVVEVSMAGRRGRGEVGIYLALGVEAGAVGCTCEKSRPVRARKERARMHVTEVRVGTAHVRQKRQHRQGQSSNLC